MQQWSAPWPSQGPYYQQANPNVYNPPYSPSWQQPIMNPTQAATASANNAVGYRGASKWSNLHPALAADSSLIRFDVGKRPLTEILAQMYYANRYQQATWNGAKHLRLISKHFPWSIELILPDRAVTCENVWDALYAALQQHIQDSEWGLIAADKKQRETVEKTAKKRMEWDGDKHLKRIDWLGETVLFRGLEKNEEFEKARLMPGGTPCAETWLVKLCS